MRSHLPAAALLLAVFLPPPLAAREAPALSLRTDGGFETVFRWRNDACDRHHAPDAPARAFRAPDGKVRLIAAHFVNRAMVGATLSAVRPDCTVLYRASGSDDPEAADDRVWLTAFHVLRSGRILALGHAEYHGHLRKKRCPAGSYSACWRNAVIEANSIDGARSFHRAPGANAVIATLPYPYDSAAGRRTGYFSPSNIFTFDGRLHAFVFAEAYRGQRRGACLLRRGSEGVWRAWDGSAFEARLSRADRPLGHGAFCSPIPGLDSTVTSVVRHRPSGTYVALFAGTRKLGPAAPPVTGVYYLTSRDLRRWSRPALLAELPVMFRYDCGRKRVYGYPSLLAEDGGRNFETAGDTAWLYLTRFNMKGCRLPADRDLVRVRVQLSGRF